MAGFINNIGYQKKGTLSGIASAYEERGSESKLFNELLSSRGI